MIGIFSSTSGILVLRAVILLSEDAELSAAVTATPGCVTGTQPCSFPQLEDEFCKDKIYI